MNDIDQLCPHCGLCCDGTLYADVELSAGDDPGRLSKLGLSLKKKGRVRMAFTQPCACFDASLCKIYADRPGRCRWFECGLLKQVQAGKMTSGVALKKISKARTLRDKVRELLKSFKGSCENAALSERYAQAMSEPANLSTGESDRHGRLIRTYAELMKTLQRDFLEE